MNQSRIKTIMKALEQNFALQDYVRLYPDFTQRIGPILEIAPPELRSIIDQYLQAMIDPAPEAKQLADALGFSQAEAELSLALVDGYSLDEIAKRRNVSRFTVRNQLQNIYQKTQINRQPALIRKVLDVLHPK